ncbi:chromosome segregation SMC family protein [Clavibacter tessellarius]|uniref:chromosome segregation SMC family protein n=1 Tax=Clavibacter tessellarius TaxID=31965 RepID=UPI0039BFB3AB
MHLKSLTLKGFKSFAQPTTFQFETGVTCVVGPNGSGKSNVVDALAWVMGEQGAKTLRGGKMEDVIFAGTSTRGPLGRAEVTLTIDNADGALPIDYTEVAIRRTLFRNGGSEYAINGTSCRLLDVQELLSDSGLGREMHVIVGQGRLDNVLRATPEERRGFIEEAAGILKHRRRKERTLRKLEGMQANLTRLNDLAGEIRRQLKPLGRQAEVARQAQTVAAVVRDARARLVADEVVGLRRALAEHTRTEEERTTERMVLQEKLDRAVLRSARIVEEQEGDEVDGARRTAFALEQVQERLRNLLSLAQQRLALLGSADDAPEAAAGTAPAQVQESRDEAERLVALIAEAEAGWASARQATAAARQALDALDEEIQAQSALVSRHDLEIAGLTGRAETAGSRLAAVRGEVLRQQNALDAARARLAAAEAERERGEAEGAADEQGGSELTRAYEDAQADVASEESAIEAVREELHARSASATPWPRASRPWRARSTSATDPATSSPPACRASAASSPSTCMSTRASRPRSPRRSARSPTRCSPTRTRTPWRRCAARWTTTSGASRSSSRAPAPRRTPRSPPRAARSPRPPWSTRPTASGGSSRAS